jgi:hypothetical protein
MGAGFSEFVFQQKNTAWMITLISGCLWIFFVSFSGFLKWVHGFQSERQICMIFTAIILIPIFYICFFPIGVSQFIKNFKQKYHVMFD